MNLCNSSIIHVRQHKRNHQREGIGVCIAICDTDFGSFIWISCNFDFLVVAYIRCILKITSPIDLYNTREIQKPFLVQSFNFAVLWWVAKIYISHGSFSHSVNFPGGISQILWCAKLCSWLISLQCLNKSYPVVTLYYCSSLCTVIRMDKKVS
jgi:hypothetical protein